MSVEQVKAYFKAFGMADRVREFEVSSATVELAAQALGCEGARIAKSLAFMVDGEPVLVVTAGDAKIDNRKFKEFFHTKAKMTTPEETVNRIGHAIGGVCPFALKEGVTVYLDVSLRRFAATARSSSRSKSLKHTRPLRRGSMSAKDGRGRKRHEALHYRQIQGRLRQGGACTACQGAL